MYIPPSCHPRLLTEEEREALRQKEARKDKLHENYMRRKASGAQKRYEDKIRAAKKAEIDAKKDAIRAEDNVLFYMNYKLPDGYTFVDAGIKLGDNNGISYYDIQQLTYKTDDEAKGIMAGLGAISALAGSGGSGVVLTGKAMFSEYNTVKYVETEENVLDKELNASTLARYMYESKPVNVEKYPPIYWQAKAVTKGMSGSMATLPPLRFAQKYGGRNYIYGIGWLRYKDKSGKIQTIYTEALPAAVKYMPTNPVAKQGS